MFVFNHVMRTVVAAAMVVSMASAVRADEEHPVKYRLAAWKSMHFDTEAAAVKDADYLKKTLGCEVELGSHDGHYDVKYRCPSWKMVKANSDDAAHELQAWLKKRGFETEHVH